MIVRRENAALRLVLYVAMPDADENVKELLEQEGIRAYYRFTAEGAATSDVLKMMGLDSNERFLYIAYLTGEKAHSLIRKIHLRLQVSKRVSGIACSIPINGMSQAMMKIVRQISAPSPSGKAAIRKENERMKSEHSLIVSVVNRGYIQDVLHTARTEGAHGGTVVHSFRVSDEDINNMFGLSSEEEKEILIMIVNAEKKIDILHAISSKFGMSSEAKGLVFSIPVDETSGYEEYEED